ncbi:phosphoribosylanthranilate isomerase [Mycolicibacterium sp. BK556]|uniref:phosphoribosylanthranilate isomerase n=1 Tax=unclassified Mycolicibacterium TaxID=2636767 RepID=UPI00161F9B47|nr:MULTISPECIES: phosphoribosylanthranilate isomerase [unclassified Mycolicibacterium]MBB3602020.1 phosphoribosylanthranilate isomerase [Mycolicibacterium sp. BK556]MBB3631772.1 phosphoribosylanthranilate isomerase [Mycolicibacterium sp. BK607]
MIHVKICGIRRLQDALAAAEYGADALGFLVGQRHSSPDFLQPDEAATIIAALPPVDTVLVTHLSEPDDIVTLAITMGVATIQLHGDTSPNQTRAIKDRMPDIKLAKAIHVIDHQSIDTARQYANTVDALVLDTINTSTDQVGGTGQTHDWSISRQIVAQVPIPAILAGGLTPDNVADAIRNVRPYGVDVNSGTKGPDGYKDRATLKRFIENAKGQAD